MAMNKQSTGTDETTSKANETPVSGKTPSNEEELKRKARMSKINHKIAVIIGKGGVGKSTITANLAMAFATWLRKQGGDT